MTVMKTVISTLDMLLVMMLFFVGRESKDKQTAIGFGIMIVLILANICMIWK